MVELSTATQPMSDAEISTMRRARMLRGALGADVLTALADDDIVEIMLNPDGKVFFESHLHGMYDSGARFTPDEANRLVATIAGHSDKLLTVETPELSTVLENYDKARIQAYGPPVTAAACFTIRKRPKHIYPLDSYIDKSIISESHANAVRQAIDAHDNIIIAGGTGSGKTTFTNAIIAAIVEQTPRDRCGIIEDTAELKCTAENHFSFLTNPLLKITMADLVRASLRSRPDRIIVGEVRGGEALDLLKAWNTGNPGGVATIHANNAASVVQRLDNLAREAQSSSQLDLIAITVNLIVHITGKGLHRRVKEVVRVDGLNTAGAISLRPV